MKNLTEFAFSSHGAGSIHAYLWAPEGKPIGIVQLVHGIAEHVRLRLFDGRHEILREPNRAEIFTELAQFLDEIRRKSKNMLLFCNYFYILVM